MEQQMKSEQSEQVPARKAESIEEAEAAIEAILFAAGDSVELEKISKAIGHDTETTGKILNHMMDQYQASNRGIRILELEHSYQMCTKQEYYEYLINIALQPKKAVLTDVMLETLSIIAYKQPVTKQEIEKIRGVKSDHAVNKLVEYNLVQELGRLDAPGRPIVFGTTEEFLRNFGVDSTENLPQISPVKIEDFKAEVEEEMQVKLDI
ncbi:MAG: SMC-Scp complex subunit ScpB [Lachnospiraceae bacterium]|nr:SMC-Scp complex subunit ScpB [Lachnospiraceae bacterium]